MNNQKAKNHHFVPRCYLKNFTSDGKLLVLDIRKITSGVKHFVKTLSPKSICTLEDYYTIYPNDLNSQFKLEDHDKLFVETEVLGSLEYKYGKSLYCDLTSKTEIPLSDAIDLSDFIIQLKLRNPYWLEQQMKKKDEMIDSAMKAIYRDKLQSHSLFEHIPDEIKKLVADYVAKDNKSNPNFGKMMQLFSLIQRASETPQNNNKIRQAIIDCEWKLFIAPKNGPKFITSDNPGFATSSDNLNYNTKFTNGFIFFLPVSPDYCLVISDTTLDKSFTNNDLTKYIQRVNIDAKMVININNKAIQMVNKLLIASDDWYLSQIAEKNKPTYQ